MGISKKNKFKTNKKNETKNNDTFKKIYIYTTTKNQPTYDMLKNEYGVEINYLNDLISHEDFDDQSEQKLILELLDQFAVSGRHSHFTCIFLIQNYCSLSLCIRGQCEYIVLLKSSNPMNMKAILMRTNCNIDNKMLYHIVSGITSKQLQYCIVDNLADEKYRLRQNITNIINIKATVDENMVIYYPKQYDNKKKEIVNVTNATMRNVTDNKNTQPISEIHTYPNLLRCGN